jgi:hypothetical protein
MLARDCNILAAAWCCSPGDDGVIRVSCEVLKQVYECVGKRPHEHGGILGGNPSTGVISHFWFDETGDRNGASYTPDIAAVNDRINGEWKANGVKFTGFVHSHPPYCRRPSCGDEVYARDILAAKRSLKRLMVWIVMSEAGGAEYELFGFVADRADDGGIVVKKLEIVPTDENGVAVDASIKGECAVPVDVPAPATAGSVVPVNLIAAARPERIIEVARMFDRVGAGTGAYDLRRLARCRAVVVGVGGARKVTTLLARAGVEEFILIDPDSLSEENLATQDCFRDEIGCLKVEAAKTEIRRINPNARVIPLPCRLDEISDGEFERLANAPLTEVPFPGRTGFVVDLPPVVTVIAACTDNFYAQARCNRLGLQFSLPTMASGVYQHGLGVEVAFTHPDTTPACLRCALRSRYEAFLKGPEPKVTSHGAPISSTQRLASLEMQILLSLFHHGTDHPHFGSMLNRIGNRNLIQVRCHPSLADEIGVRTFERVFKNADATRLFADETVWIPQEPENGRKGRKPCPDCMGTGNLLNSRGRFRDTRILSA